MKLCFRKGIGVGADDLVGSAGGGCSAAVMIHDVYRHWADVCLADRWTSVDAQNSQNSEKLCNPQGHNESRHAGLIRKLFKMYLFLQCCFIRICLGSANSMYNLIALKFKEIEITQEENMWPGRLYIK